MKAPLVVQARSRRGKGYRLKLAAEGKIPAVVYGKSLGNVPVEVNLKELRKLLGGEVVRGKLVDLKIIGDGWEREEKAIINEVQQDPLTDEPIHVDFHQVSLTEEATATVPVELVGEPAGVKQGGILEQHLWEVEVACLPTALPEAIRVDVSALGVGDTLFVHDLPVPPGVRLLLEPGEVVASVTAPAGGQAEAEPKTEPGETA
ncbi:50S ribosomal protein L25 [Desulfothermobacter acidiphilus]|uniref:50S ribosomal protein L25 n=1 Tax=Desulfothermobacter acidiphilus TaxID=1938353 RepID=UPI003F8B78E2